MKRSTKILIGSLLVVSIIGITMWARHASQSKQSSGGMKTEAPVKMDIIKKRVIAGSLVPHKEVALKTKIGGTLDKLYVAVGDEVTQGTVIARIKAAPTSSDVISAKKDLQLAQIVLEAATAKYQRNKQLFEKKMLSPAQYETHVKAWKIAREEAAYAQKKLDFVRKGHIEGVKGASNIITATMSGTVAELPCKEGSIVMEQTTHHEGSTLATIADMRVMLFQGSVGEMDVAHLSKGLEFDISLNAIKGKKFSTTLTKVAPKAIKAEQNESIKFAIEGIVKLTQEDKPIIRAGYTAMADIVLEQAINVLAIKERCLPKNEAPSQSPKTQEDAQEANTSFVWVYENNQKVKKPVKLGISNGIYVEVKEGLTESDQVIVEDDSH